MYNDPGLDLVFLGDDVGSLSPWLRDSGLSTSAPKFKVFIFAKTRLYHVDVSQTIDDHQISCQNTVKYLGGVLYSCVS